MAQTKGGQYPIRESWRPINSGEGMQLGSGINQSLIQILEGGPSLLYYRKSNDLCGEYTLFARSETGSTTTAGESVKLQDYSLIAQMIDGKIALGTLLESHILFIDRGMDSKGGPGDYLKNAAKALDGLFPYFENIPSDGKDIKTEIETLRQINEASARILAGDFTQEDLNFFWKGAELIG